MTKVYICHSQHIVLQAKLAEVAKSELVIGQKFIRR